MTPKNGMKPVHPGEILREEMGTLGLSAEALSKALGVPRQPRHGDPERPPGRDPGHRRSAGSATSIPRRSCG